jgi:glycosidase
MLAPLLYQINTRAFLTALGLSRPATLDDVPDTAIDAIAARGFTWVWMLSVWQLGAAGREVARTNPAWRAGYEAALPDVREADIQSSGFAIVDYTAARELGGPEALARLRSRLAARGLKLMLDFVPNHMALDSLWIAEHPDYFVAGTVDALQREPANYALIQTGSGPRVLAHGRDPNFDGWPDTLQLDYTNPALCQAQRLNLLDIAEQCDGVRADMAMLLLPDVFERTWHRRPEEFWPGAIAAVKSEQPDFMFAAEVYWDLESAMHARGFDYAYDKRLYDRLRDADAAGVRDHLTLAPASYQHKLVRFLENHDEPRAAATFAPARHEAAAVLSFLTPGLKLLYDGEIEGARIRLPVQLMRAPAEPLDQTLVAFYDALLAVLRRPVFHGG